NAVFVPPHQDEVADLVSDLEKFWHNDQVRVPHLIKAAISHYQFETIHPFLDGNGRIGRLLITLYLVSNGLLRKPSLYLSDFFERNRGAYYDALTTVRASSNLLHWVKFFLTAVIGTAEKGKQAFEGVLALRQRYEAELVSLGRRAENGRKLLLYLYRKPIISGKEVADQLAITPRAANGLIDAFVERGILKEETGYRRNRVFIMNEYLEWFWK
ncbi:MAG: Fic family protein, partial [Porticoccaceae bacterium]|nr:Fic family protein [Porticoccaceae bacterium]